MTERGKEREKLIELLRNQNCPNPLLCDKNCKYAHLESCYEDRTADWLLSNGVVCPPCKVGDTLYVISQMRDKRILPFVNEYEATFIQIGKRKCKVYHEKDGFIKIFSQDDFGKTVFLTKEEAEKTLKEGSN